MAGPRKLLVVQINLHHCEAASADLVTFLINSQTDVALIQEPWINNNKVRGLKAKGYTLFVPSTEDRVRTCILAKSELSFLISHSFRSGDITVINGEAKGKRMLTLASVYMPYESTDPPGAEVHELTAYAKKRGAILVMGCDANAHHCQWGSKDINKRGELLFDFITTNNLIICNMGNTPTFRNKDRDAVIDITLINRYENLVRDWKVSTDCSFSDHSRITFSLNFDLVRSTPFKDPRKTNWGDFNDRVRNGLAQQAIGNLLSTNIEGTVNKFTNLLKESYELSCPKIFPGRRVQPKWWTRELRDQRSTVRRLFNRAKLTRQETDWNSYKMSFNKYKSDLKRAKRSSWLQYCETIDNVNDLSKFRRILSKDPVALGYIQRCDGSWTESSSETLTLLMETHFPGCLVAEGVVNVQWDLESTAQTHIYRYIEDIVTREKLAWAVDSFDPYKSPGPDGIFPAMLCNLPEDALGLLLLIFKRCLCSRYLPKWWREVKVIFIPKAGKASHSKPKDFRPISLSSFLLKTLERLIDLYLRNNIDTHLISNAQHAYLKGKSVESALHEVVGCIEHGLKYKEYTLAAFLDIEGAFNNIKIEAIRDSLHELGVQDFLVEWIVCMLSSRIINSNLGDHSIRRRVTRGTPQGGVLSPLLWLLSVNGILKQFESTGRKIVAYADDVVLLVKGKFLPTISNIMENALGELSSWAKLKGLGVNPAKTELVLFTRRYKIDNFRMPKLDGVSLGLSSGAKYLGTFLDCKLSWKENTQARMKKGLNAYYCVWLHCLVGGLEKG